MKTIPKILIVDDSANIRHVIKRYISASVKFECIEACNGFEAEQILQEAQAMDTPVEIVILDWMMPEMSGLEFLKKIRCTDVFAVSPKIIMLTAETYSEQINACVKYGVSQYLTKPFTQEDISGAVLKLLESQEVNRAV